MTDSRSPNQAIVVVGTPTPTTSVLFQSLESTHDYEVVRTSDHTSALRYVAEHDPDMIILSVSSAADIATLETIRASSDAPTIVISTVQDESWPIKALDAGADDYVATPVALGHLTARIRAILRRAKHITTKPYLLDVGDLQINLSKRTAFRTGKQLDLTPREFDLLACLARQQGRVAKRDTIIAELWQGSDKGNDETIAVHLCSLRRKLGESAANPKYIHTVRGVGLKLSSGRTQPDDMIAPRQPGDDANHGGARRDTRGNVSPADT